MALGIHFSYNSKLPIFREQPFCEFRKDRYELRSAMLLMAVYTRTYLIRSVIVPIFDTQKKKEEGRHQPPCL